MNIPFNKPFLSGKELEYIREAVHSGKISGNGLFTGKCQNFFEQQYGFGKTLLTTSCTDALEMASLLVDIEPGDEVIVPSFTFVSSANAFILRGANIRFADSRPDHPGIDESKIEELITPKTKAIVPVHYAGVACDMDPIMELSKSHGIAVIEDAAQAVQSYYKGEALGGIGDLGAFSFHETKNIISGEGGMLTINRKKYESRSEIIWEKGTNRSAFFRGEIDKYGWVDQGSSFLPSELTSAFLFAQLEQLEQIQNRRLELWQNYQDQLVDLEERIGLPVIPDYATNNAHMYYILCGSIEERSALIAHLKENNIKAVFHYLSLHKSPFYQDRHDGRDLAYSDYYTQHILRLPLYYELSDTEQQHVIDCIKAFYNTH